MHARLGASCRQEGSRSAGSPAAGLDARRGSSAALLRRGVIAHSWMPAAPLPGAAALAAETANLAAEQDSARSTAALPLYCAAGSLRSCGSSSARRWYPGDPPWVSRRPLPPHTRSGAMDPAALHQVWSQPHAALHGLGCKVLWLSAHGIIPSTSTLLLHTHRRNVPCRTAYPWPLLQSATSALQRPALL